MKINEQLNTSIILVEHAQEALINVEEANTNLREAHEYQKGGSHLYAYIFLAMTAVMWAWEWLNSRKVYV